MGATKGKNNAKKEDWVVGKNTRKPKSNSGSALPQRRSERVFIKDSVINYADPAEEEKETEEEMSHESPPKENLNAKLVISPTLASIPLQNLSLSTIAKISQKESEKETDYGLESDSRRTADEAAGKCPTCEKKFNRQNFYFRRHKERCALSSSSSSSSGKTDERRECPVCFKSYTMIGRGHSYYKDHLKACRASSSQDAKNTKSTDSKQRKLDDQEVKECSDNVNSGREMIDNKSGAEMICNDMGQTFEETRKGSSGQIGEREKDATKEGRSAAEVHCEPQEINY